MKLDRIKKIQNIISELGVLISDLKERGDEIGVQRCSEIRSDYIEDLKKVNFTD